MQIFDYSLIRAVPDPRRGEWVNIGVCVYHTGNLDVHLTDSYNKIRALDPNADLRLLRRLSHDWNSICEDLGSAVARQAILSGLPFAHASPLAQFVCDTESYEEQVRLLLRDLIVPPVAIREKREPRLRATLKNHLIRAKLYSEDPSAISQHKVVANFPVMEEAKLFADFAARNGVMHITETIDFRVKSDQLRNRHGQAAIKSITLDKAGEIFPDCKRNVVFAYNDQDLDEIQPSLNLLRDYSMNMFNAGNPKDLADFVELTASALRQRLEP
ncbi:DUF3037 domain-containing protein [Dokdonella immobilis]|uniref:DUF3037 domain-containing protein n=1 Tax=Dokdonella immobilis TaxID=578942 RepID=A0A1I5AXA9_9GAMM|nr:DUF3037 domain-containing protein [Dokdonella immobilis]SFN67052.1 Protein of unknown function [Dokdonella immobilis]